MRRISKIKLLLCLLIITFQVAKGDDRWKVVSSLKTIPQSDVKRFVLTFELNGRQLVFTPTTPPYGLSSEKDYLFNGQQYFLTGWVKGAHTFLYRVFQPEKQGEKALCEYVSFSESAELRWKKDQLEILITESELGESQWFSCPKTTKPPKEPVRQ